MGWIIFLVAIVVIVAFLGNSLSRGVANRPGSSGHRISKKDKVLDDLAFLQDRWTERARDREAGRECFPRWWWDEPTERQLNLLQSIADEQEVDEIRFKPRTKGSVSDVIGLFQPPEAEDIEKLKFFKQTTSGLNETVARYKASAVLYGVPENLEKWNTRPIDVEQKEFFKFFGLEARKGMTWNEASVVMADTLRADDPKTSEWYDYQSLVEDLLDPDNVDLYEVKKPSRATLRRLIAEQIAAGLTYDDLSVDVEQIYKSLPKRKGAIQN